MHRLSSALVFGILAAWGPLCGAAQPIEVSEGEISFYLQDFTAHRGACDAGWFRQQMTETARATHRLPRETIVYTRDEYAQMIRDNCRLYSSLEWDQMSFKSSASGGRGMGEWQVTWSPGTTQHPVVRLSERVDVVRQGYGLRISGITMRLQELAASGEEQFRAASEGSGLLAVVQQLYDGMANGLRRWGKPKPAQPAETNF